MDSKNVEDLRNAHRASAPRSWTRPSSLRPPTQSSPITAAGRS